MSERTTMSERTMDINSSKLGNPELSEMMQAHGFGSYDFRDNSMDSDEAYRLGSSLAYLYGNGNTVVVGRDHRNHSEDIKDGLLDGLWDNGCEVEYIGMAPTDAIAHRVQDTDAAGGVAVTASHMPPIYRGIKPLTDEGRIFDEEELYLTLEGYQELTETRDNYMNWQADHAGKAHKNYISDAASRYRELFDEDLSGMEIGIDPGNGIGGYTLPTLLRELGVEEDNLHLINQNPDPEFPGRGPDPTDSDLHDLRELVREEELDIGLALDGDADRVVYVNEKGEKVPGSESLALLGEKYLDQTWDKPLGEEGSFPVIACSVNTSPVVAEHNKGAVSYTPVGAVFPAKKALEDRAKITFGGQPNGHFIDGDFVGYDSGTLMGAVMPGILNEADTSLSDLQDNLQTYNVHRDNIELDEINAETKEEAMEELREIYRSTGIPRKVKGAHRIDFQNKETDELDFGRTVIFRPSGNEDVIRWTRIVKAGEEELDMVKRKLNGH